MTPELQNKLYKEYPKIFGQKDLSKQESAMAWGISCGDGWYHIIYDLCATLQEISDREGTPQIEAAQIKEKFGTLTIYVSNATEEHHKAIDQAEQLSSRTCEECGTMRNTSRRVGGWILTLCDKCYESSRKR